uniref:Fe2OG dioxygenase domain-containing protein n=1 Tax=Rhizophora mucronata TaxID=61149 RepID=A0A2P2KWD6_RHIMU
MMLNSDLQLNSTVNGSSNGRKKELKAFDESKAGVKGLVDAGIVKIPSIFVLPPSEVPFEKSGSGATCALNIPVIDLKDFHTDGIRHEKIVEEIRQASERWGFFQVVNHGVSNDIMTEMIAGVCRFHEQKKEVKMEYYTRDNDKKLKFISNNDLYVAKTANWRDSLYLFAEAASLAPEEIPEVCRQIVIEYSEHVKGLGLTIFQLLSEALGLKPCYLVDIDCAKGYYMACHYYPACPEPNRTLGTSGHTDPVFMTILLQDHIGGLQVLFENEWIDVPPIPGAFVVNVGDLLQLMSNDKFRSGKHRVLANQIGPRISVAFFFTTRYCPSGRLYGPIKDLLSRENPPLYKEVLERDYFAHFYSKGLDDVIPALDHFRLHNGE